MFISKFSVIAAHQIYFRNDTLKIIYINENVFVRRIKFCVASL